MDAVLEDDAEELARRQAELRQDVDTVNAYGEQVPEVWTGVRFDGPDLVALFTDPAAHEQRLRGLVDHPDRLRVEWARYSRRQLSEVHREVMEGLEDGTWQSHGPGVEQVGLGLRSTEEVLAQRIHERYGDAVEIRLGRHRYPLSDAEVPPPRPAPVSTIGLGVLTASAVLERTAHRPGALIRGSVALRNESDEVLRVVTRRPARGVLLDTDRLVVGVLTVPTRGVGLRLTLPARHEERFAFVAGTDTLDPRRGAVLGAGEYLLVVPVRLTLEGDPETRGVLTTDPVPVTLTDGR